MISAIIILNGRGEVLVTRSFRDNVITRAVADAFRTQLVATKAFDRSPVRFLGATSYLHIRHEDLFFVAVTKDNVNAAMAFRYLYQLRDIFKAYFGGRVDEKRIKENFSIVYELLDETMDFGYPQTLDADVLKLYIQQEGMRDSTPNQDMEKVTIQATGAISWRREGLKYRKNEAYIDVVENVNLLLSNKGTILHTDVFGKIICRTFLSGMPECKIGLNDKLIDRKRSRTARRTPAGQVPEEARKGPAVIEIDDLTFHQCVKLGRFDSDRTISFVPPDGEFELMRYRITDNIKQPFRILPPIIRELGRTRLEIQVTVKASFSARMVASNVVVKIPVPKNTARVNVNVAAGKAKYSAEHGAVVWKIRRFPGGATEYSLSGEVELVSSTSGKTEWSRPPISMDFQVPMFAASGLHIRYLEVLEPKMNYQTIKWVRYITKAGQYEHRI